MWLAAAEAAVIRPAEETGMHSSIIGKIQKANLYAREPERLGFTQFSTTFRGDNDSHTVSYEDSRWNCTCDFFHGWGICSHTMALEKMMGAMLPKEARQSMPTGVAV
jgi:hypothetical protein